MRPYPDMVKPDLEKSRVLIVDDSAEMRRFLRAILEVLDLALDEAADGADALAKLAARDYDIVLTDLEMKPRTGFDLIEGLSALPANRTKPSVIVCSALVGTYEINGRRELLDVAALLPKPIRPDELLGEVIRLLDEVPARPA